MMTSAGPRSDRNSAAVANEKKSVRVGTPISMAFAAWSAPGCYGARLSGAGFGGCVNALVDAEAAAEVEQRVQRDFERAFGRPCATFVSSFGPGATIQFLE